jgi:hypothetical protein
MIFFFYNKVLKYKRKKKTNNKIKKKKKEKIRKTLVVNEIKRSLGFNKSISRCKDAEAKPLAFPL